MPLTYNRIAAWEADRRHYDEKHDWDNSCGGNRVLQAHVILDRVKRCTSGDYAELGTYQGNYARIIYSQMAEDASLYCFDTFTGFPEPQYKRNSEPLAMPCLPARFPTPLKRKWNRRLLTALHRRALSCASVNSQQPSSASKTAGGASFCLTPPIKAGLEMFWPRLVPGGFILCHDYLFGYPGVRKAVDEFFDPLGIVPVPWPDRVGTAVVGS
jgi:O-methyltransferase